MFLRLFTRPGQDHLAELELNVHPTERGKGTGTRLLDAALRAAREADRRAVLAQAEAGSPGDRFLSGRGFRKVLTLIYARLALADTDLGRLAEIVERPHPGYRLVSWDGTVPDDLARTFAASRRAMDDMPMGDTDYGTVVWDVERVRARRRPSRSVASFCTPSRPSTNRTARSPGSPNSWSPATAWATPSTTAPACCPSTADTPSAAG